MAEREFDFRVLSPLGTAFDGKARAVTLPTPDGEITVLVGPHAHGFRAHRTGRSRSGRPDREVWIAVSGGFLETGARRGHRPVGLCGGGGQHRDCPGGSGEGARRAAPRGKEGARRALLVERDLQRAILQLKVAQKIRTRRRSAHEGRAAARGLLSIYWKYAHRGGMHESRSDTLETYGYDLVIVGSGLAGMRAALAAAHLSDGRLRIALVSKLHAMRSHSVSAEGGISGVLYPGEADDTADLHAFDTVKGGDYLGDQPAIETLVAEAPKEIRFLDHLGTPWNRDDKGRIVLRAFGGMTVPRTAFGADKTGFFMMSALYDSILCLPEYRDPARALRH